VCERGREGEWENWGWGRERKSSATEKDKKRVHAHVKECVGERVRERLQKRTDTKK